jgi:DHA1 family tetracycline resistance protein-like MFS transporter
MRNRTLLALALVQFVDLVGYSLLLPLLPEIQHRFGLSTAGIGVLLATHAAAALLGAAVLGRMSDRWGRKPVLVGTSLLAAEALLVLGFAQDLPMLLLARFASGFAAGNIVVCEAARADLRGDRAEKASGMATMVGSYGLGLLVGPLLAGVFAPTIALPANIAAVMAVAALAAVIGLMTEPTPAAEGERLSAGLHLGELMHALRAPRVGPLLWVRFWYGFAVAVFQSVITLYLVRRFGLTTSQQGWILAYAGLAVLAVESLAVRRMAMAKRKRLLLEWSILASAALLFVWPLAPDVRVLAAVVGPLAASIGLVTTDVAALLSKSVPEEDIGMTLGLASSAEGVARVFAPVIGTLLISLAGLGAPGLVSASVLVALTAYVSGALAKEPGQRRRPQPA